jgi:hypothetical protein
MNLYPTPEEFLTANPRRRVPEWDFGDRWLDSGVRHRISWLPSTREVIVTAVDSDPGPIEVLGTVDDPEHLRALIRRTDGRYPLPWARERIRNARRDPAGIAAAIAEADDAEALAETARRAIDRARYAVVAVRDLPDPDRELGLVARPCACRDCMAGDWTAVAEVAVALFELGFDPLEVGAIRRAAARILPVAEQEMVTAMFSRPIALYRSGEYGNGRHRAHALRRSDAERCVIVRR